MKSLLCLTMIFCLLFMPIQVLGEAVSGTPICQQVTLEKWETTQDNKSVVRMWYPHTQRAEINDELSDIMNEYRDALSGTLPKAGNATTKNSRLDVDCRYSRTGTSWLSFLITARVTVKRQFESTDLVSRTYDMETGEPVLLTDLFPEDSPAWDVLHDEVGRQVRAYFPDVEPEADVLNGWLTRESLQQADFTLHAMSLVLHYPASEVYPGRNTLLEVTIMYPTLAGMMTEEAEKQTDNSAYKFVALTYDDGPSRTPTTQLLNKLRERGVRATFFILGNRIKENQDLVQREHDEGHAVAAHNYHHGNVSKSSASQIRRQVTMFNAALQKAIGLLPRYDRVPLGLYNEMINAKAGWPLIQWSLDTYDWRGLSPANILNTVKKQVSDGDIILFHDIKEKAADTADGVISYLEEQGYMFVTIDELFARDGVTLEPDTVYYHCINGNTSRK